VKKIRDYWSRLHSKDGNHEVQLAILYLTLMALVLSIAFQLFSALR